MIARIFIEMLSQVFGCYILGQGGNILTTIESATWDSDLFCIIQTLLRQDIRSPRTRLYNPLGITLTTNFNEGKLPTR